MQCILEMVLMQWRLTSLSDLGIAMMEELDQLGKVSPKSVI